MPFKDLLPKSEDVLLGVTKNISFPTPLVKVYITAQMCFADVFVNVVVVLLQLLYIIPGNDNIRKMLDGQIDAWTDIH